MKKSEQMLQSVQQWKESGLTQKDYCQMIGVKRTTFANWVRRSREKAGSGFLAISPPSRPVSQSIEVVYPNGVRVKASTSDIPVLSALIRIF
jgi:transposase-like protein